MRRIGDLLPAAAAALGIDAELRRARAAAAWQRIVGERVPAAAGLCHLEAWDEAAGRLAVAASQPIVAQEIRLRTSELLEAFGRSMGGRNPEILEVVVRSRAEGGGSASPP
ncbi:MAG: DciA family protein [Candidatus Limnocylindrales bacterium]